MTVKCKKKNRGSGKRNSKISKIFMTDAVVVLIFYIGQMFPSFFGDCREFRKTQFSFFRPTRTSGDDKNDGGWRFDEGKWN